MHDLRKTLMSMYEAMLSRFGPRHWWPARAHLVPRDRKLEICLGAILTQNTNWGNVEKALDSLDTAGAMRVDVLAKMPPARLAELIRPAGYFNVKAKRLKNFIAHVTDRHGGSIEDLLAVPEARLREQLLGINGIGPETADSMVLYAAGKCTFVVDAYTRRICLRHGLISPRDGYEAVKSLFESHVPSRTGLYNDYHAQLVAVGKHFCRPRARCSGCPLERFDHDASLPPLPPRSRR
jgi:endonuclease-3 related protein